MPDVTQATAPPVVAVSGCGDYGLESRVADTVMEVTQWPASPDLTGSGSYLESRVSDTLMVTQATTLPQVMTTSVSDLLGNMSKPAYTTADVSPSTSPSTVDSPNDEPEEVKEVDAPRIPAASSFLPVPHVEAYLDLISD